MTARQWRTTCVLFAGHMALVGAIFLPLEQAPEWIAMAWLGALLGQITALSAWSAMAPWRAVIFRAPTALFLLALWWLVLVLYLRVEETFYLQAIAMVWAAIGLLVFGVVFVLARLGSWLSRWQITFASSSSNGEIGTGQFRIAHVLLATAGTAILLGLGRDILPAEGWGVPPLLRSEVLGIFGMSAVVISVNTLAMMPASLWGAQLERRSLTAFLFVWPLYAFLITLGEVGILQAMEGSSSNEKIWGLLALNVVQGPWLVASLLTLRWAGWRLGRLRCLSGDGKRF